MWPWLKYLYKENPQQLPSVLERYLETFNTHPVMASFCFGALAKQEEKIAKDRSSDHVQKNLLRWVDTRRSLSITTASIGDRLFWGSLKPLTLLLALFICLFLHINFFEPDLAQTEPSAYIWVALLSAWLVFNSVALFVKWIGISLGYRCEENVCFGLICFDWNKTIYYAKKIGILLALLMLFLGAYFFFKATGPLPNYHAMARGTLMVFFILCSWMAHKLRVANLYIYLIAVLMFGLVSLF